MLAGEEVTLSRRSACLALGVHRTKLARFLDAKAVDLGDKPAPARAKRARPSHSLSEKEESEVLDILCSPEFVDHSPQAVYFSLLDRGRRYCSVSTMHRILRRHQAAADRQQRRRNHNFKKPQLLATSPNQVWSWDITLLKGPVRGVFYYLYVMMDIFSRRVVAWMLAKRECEDLASQFIAEACKAEKIGSGDLTIHSDRGPSMKSLGVAELYRRLGVERSLGRPSVSNDNPFSEALYKTVKYCPAFPGSFNTFEEAQLFCTGFFGHYNGAHYHSGICFLTPNSVHFGRAEQILAARHEVEMQAYFLNPKRYPKGPPKKKILPGAVWINDPAKELACAPSA